MISSATLVEIIGKEDLSQAPDLLESLSSDESFARPQRPLGRVKVHSVEQVQRLVDWANRAAVPLVPVSSGPPHFHGDTVPSLPGAVIVDLSSMKKIIHLDLRNRMVIIEPGITFGELQPELAKSGLRLSSPLRPRANKSVLTSLLEREPIIIPRYQWAALDPLRCLEIVWGDGQRITTGEAGSIGTLQEEWTKKLAQVNPQGPAQTDFYKVASAAQGSMGIATWASLKCELLPSVHRLFVVPAENLSELIDLAYAILRIRFGDELLIVNAACLANLLRNGGGLGTDGPPLPDWALLVGIAGRERLPARRVAFQERDLAEMARQCNLSFLPDLPGMPGEQVLKTVLSPSAEPYWKFGRGNACQEIFFLNTLEAAPRFVDCMLSLAGRQGFPASQMAVYLQPIHQGTSCHIEFDLPFDRSSEREAALVKRLYETASRELFKLGAYYSRPYGIWSDLAYNSDGASARVIKKIKNIFDPNNVMNPGKLGL
jgi:FAD/FMN-containing dehydrogenase